MDELASAFLARWRNDGRAGTESEALVRAALQDARDAARRAWPAIDLADARFGEELAARVPAGAEPAEGLGRMNVEELYLTIACAAGDAIAIAEFEATYMVAVHAALGRLGFADGAVDEAAQTVRTSLLVANGERPPGIVDFSGRGQLRVWLRAVASRVAFRLARPEKRNVSFDDSLETHADDDLELEYLKKTYGPIFKDAFRDALAALEVKDRLLLKQRFSLHMTVVELGALHGVHASTVSRWVTETRERLVTATRDGMMARVKLGRAEVSSILRLIRSEIDVTLSTHTHAG